MISKSLYIFDLDGTLALIDHRRPILDSDDPDKWERFYAACVDDKPNIPVIETMERLSITSDILIFSGRSETVREQTVEWLYRFTRFATQSIIEQMVMLTMRPVGDYTPDHELKKLWLDTMLDEDRERLVAVFDDRYAVVKMWRENGVPCFQVAPGDF